MSVYTQLEENEVETILSGYDLGTLQQFQGIAAGIENSNFFLDTDRGRFVLTVFERVDPQDLPYFLNLMKHLAARGIPCPDVVARKDGSLLFSVRGKPGCIITRLPGQTYEVLTPVQLFSAGRMLARIHLQGVDFPWQRPNPTDMEWMHDTALAVANETGARFGSEARALLLDEVSRFSDHAWEGLPQGVIHADYFSDNLLFSGDEVSGVIDFYYACDGLWAYDLAIAINALALQLKDDDRLRFITLVKGYESERSLTPEERSSLPSLMRLAALRFWLSRLRDMFAPRQGSLVQIKDPEEYRKKLLCCRDLAQTKSLFPQ